MFEVCSFIVYSIKSAFYKFVCLNVEIACSYGHRVVSHHIRIFFSHKVIANVCWFKEFQSFVDKSHCSYHWVLYIEYFKQMILKFYAHCKWRAEQKARWVKNAKCIYKTISTIKVHTCNSLVCRVDTNIDKSSKIGFIYSFCLNKFLCFYSVLLRKGHIYGTWF